DKRRPKANVAEVMNIIGEVEGRTCVIMDDMVDTAGTLCKAASALKAHGAKQVLAYCVHAVLSGPAVERINASDIDELVVTDTIQLREDARNCPRIRQLSVADVMAETIRRISNEDSVSSLFIE
ncbi:MAG: ribose-phosphate diphosphokinase, partial [Betaproteobacteria bacterium]|nr:ribose-phosphate diphosphokinase [Betaproteobacteria bacterium]